MELSEFVCPDCHGGLKQDDSTLLCAECGAQYPIIEGVPVLLWSGSTFTATQVEHSDTTYYARKSRESTIKQRVRKSLPRLNRSTNGARAAAIATSALEALPGPARGLVVGAGENVRSIEARYPNVEWVVSDVDRSFGAEIVTDVTGLPFPDRSLSIVVADQVLEHVYDIRRAAEEIQRVLKVGGVVDIGVPFNYPWHGVPYDYYRLTPSGVRALFAGCDVGFLERAAGPWSAAAVSLNAAIIGTFGSRVARMAATFVSRLILWPLKYLDRFRPQVLESASSLSFIGVKRADPLAPADVVGELRRLVRA